MIARYALFTLVSAFLAMAAPGAVRADNDLLSDLFYCAGYASAQAERSNRPGPAAAAERYGVEAEALGRHLSLRQDLRNRAFSRGGVNGALFLDNPDRDRRVYAACEAVLADGAMLARRMESASRGRTGQVGSVPPATPSTWTPYFVPPGPTWR